jgi:hypothetical protein
VEIGSMTVAFEIGLIFPKFMLNEARSAAPAGARDGSDISKRSEH